MNNVPNLSYDCPDFNIIKAKLHLGLWHQKHINVPSFSSLIQKELLLLFFLLDKSASYQLPNKTWFPWQENMMTRLMLFSFFKLNHKLSSHDISLSILNDWDDNLTCTSQFFFFIFCILYFWAWKKMLFAFALVRKMLIIK